MGDYSFKNLGTICPSQATGMLSDGTAYYIRYRNGSVRVASDDDTTLFHLDGYHPNGTADGYMDSDQMRAILDIVDSRNSLADLIKMIAAGDQDTADLMAGLPGMESLADR